MIGSALLASGGTAFLRGRPGTSTKLIQGCVSA